MNLSITTRDYRFEADHGQNELHISFDNPIRMIRSSQMDIKEFVFTLESGGEEADIWKLHLALGKPVRVTIEPL